MFGPFVADSRLFNSLIILLGLFKAQYEHLPIYREVMRLAVHLENIVRGFASYHKYTLGSELAWCAAHGAPYELVGCVVRTSYAGSLKLVSLDVSTLPPQSIG